jgi:amidase
MARTVKDAAILLGILAGIDSKIQLPMKVKEKQTDYTKFLDAKALQGKRIEWRENLRAKNQFMNCKRKRLI